MTTDRRAAKKRIPRLEYGKDFPGLRGKVIKWVDIGEGQENDLYIHIRFKDETELCFWLRSRIVIEEADLADWKSGNLVQKRAFIQSPMVRAIVKEDAVFRKISRKLDGEQRKKERRDVKLKRNRDAITKRAMEWISQTLDYIVTKEDAKKFLSRLPRATPQLQELTDRIKSG